MNEQLNTLKNNAKMFNLDLTNAQLNQFELFNDFLQDYNKHTNLVSSNDINLIYEKHLLDSLAFYHFINNDKSYKIIDIGSGGGFPVIPMAIILTKSEIIALDSTKKKTDFIRQVAEKINLKNLKVINERAEITSHRTSYREKFDIVTSRAVGNLAQISELSLPFLKQNGKFIAYKASKLQEEIMQAKDTIEVLGGEIIEVYDYNLKLNENFERNLVYIKKITPTPNDYPRSFSAIKNNPIKNTELSSDAQL